jgi:hypothetical protein
VPFSKGEDGVLRWDGEAARRDGRWSERAREKSITRCAWIEVAEQIIDRGAITRIFDTLADPAHRPADLTAEDERYIVRRALAKGAEAGSLDGAMVQVLLRLMPGDDRLRGENKNLAAHRAIRVALLGDPSLSNRHLARTHGVTRQTVARIRADLGLPAADE